MNVSQTSSRQPAKLPCRCDGCAFPRRARGFCTMHYQRWKKYGDPNVIKPTRVPGDPWVRFWKYVKIDQVTGCWLWTGAKFQLGYGAFRVNNMQWRVHVWTWEQTNGERPRYPKGHRLEGRVYPLDHFVCSTRHCANPRHVRPVTDRENVLRSNSIQALNLAKTHCIRGHEFNDENTGRDGRGNRYCRRCEKIRHS